MMSAYYPYQYRLGNADSYFIWYMGTGDEGDNDRVLLDDAGCILTFRSLADLHAGASRRGLTVEAEIIAEPLDLDTLLRWLGTARKTTVDCETFMNAWNLFSDLASTIQGSPAHIDGRKQDRIYNKLFWGNNLPAVTPAGRCYEPIWSKSEVDRMRNVLSAGMRLFRERLLQTPTDQV